MRNELETFLDIWERETAKTIQLLESLPRDQYDSRPDPEGRSMGELAWHLAEPEGFGPFAIERDGFSRDARPEGLARPRTIEELAPAFARVHRDAAARLAKLSPDDLDRSIPFFNGQPMAIRSVLWEFMLFHGLHHRGQLSMMARQAGGRPASLYGPTRETAPLKKPS